MSALTSLLVRDEVVSVQQIEDALARQVLEGGEIDTALLELGATPENTLNSYRAASFGLPPASRDELMSVSAETLARVPAELASKHRIVPIARRDGTLHIASAEPFDAGRARSIEHALGAPVEWHIATEVRVEAALAQHYGFEIAARMRRLAEEIAAREPGPLYDVEPMLVSRPPKSLVDELFGADSDDPETLEVPPADAPDNLTDAVRNASAVPSPPATVVAAAPQSAPVLPKPKITPVEVARVVSVSAPQADAYDVRGTPTRMRTEPPTERMAPLGPARLPREVALSPTPAHGTPRPRSRRPAQVAKGPIGVGTARELLDAATDRDEVVDVFFSFARQYFEATALFAVREDRAIGLEAYNVPSVDDVHELSILFEPGGALEELTRSRTARVVDLMRKDADRALALALGRADVQPCALIPVSIRQRVVSLVYGDRAGERFRVDDIAELVELLPSVSSAFERIIRNRKVFAMQSKRPGPPAKPPTVRPPSSQPAPRAAWSSAPPPPEARAVSRPHEVPTPAGRARPSIAPTLTGLAAEPKRSTTARDFRSAASAVTQTSEAQPVRAESSRSSTSNAKAALGALGVPRSAPPPPTPLTAREQLERQPTMQLPQRRLPPSAAMDAALERAGAARASETRRSEPPRGASGYHVHDAGRELPRKEPTGTFFSPSSGIEGADEAEPPETPRPRPHLPPAKQVKLPPGTGSYKLQDRSSERVSWRPSASAPVPAGRSSLPPSSYRNDDVPSEHISIPPPPRVPGEIKSGAKPAAQSAAPSRRSSEAAITQPLGPKRASKEPAAPDRRREDRDSAAPTEVVRMPKKLRDSLRPPAAEPSQEPRAGADASGPLEQLVHDLCRCGPDDEGRLVQVILRSGDAVLPLLAQHFPGPLWFDRKRPHPRLPLGKDVSAIARALSAFGERAWPALAELMCSSDAEARFYATLLASDQVLPPLLRLFGERLFDTDPQIRLIVKDVLPQYRDLAGFAEVLVDLRARAADADAAIQDRLAALDALSVLRDVGSLPLLIRLNEAGDRQLSLPAHRALLAITGQDFGTATRKWQSWYEDNARRHRAEWLIESLMHGEQAVRATAGIELQKLTQVYYGYVAAAPKKERERTQKRYQTWWDLEGKRRFAS